MMAGFKPWKPTEWKPPEWLKSKKKKAKGKAKPAVVKPAKLEPISLKPIKFKPAPEVEPPVDRIPDPEAPSGKRIEHPYTYQGPETLADKITRMTRRGTLIGKGFKRTRKAMRRVGHKIDAEGFDVGEVISSQAVSSSWLNEIFLVATSTGAEVQIEFNDGARCHYPGTTERHYQRLLRAASKGKEVWKTFYNRAYFLV